MQISTDHKLMPWLVRHAGWLVTHYQVKVDGKTPYERLRRRPYNGEVVEFGEVVHYKPSVPGGPAKLDDRWFIGVWLGKSLASDEHLVGTASGVHRCRSIWRRPGRNRWVKKVLEEFQGTPWDPTPRKQAEPVPRGVYITLDRQIEHGPTPGCPACAGDSRIHSKACRERFETLVREHGRPAPQTPGGTEQADVEMPPAAGSSAAAAAGSSGSGQQQQSAAAAAAAAAAGARRDSSRDGQPDAG